MTNINRKEFLQTLAAAGTAAAFSSVGAVDLMAQNASSDNVYNLVAVLGGPKDEPEGLFNLAIAQMGGMKRFIKPGMKVTVKPNIGWAKTPEMAANTNPDLVAAIIKACWDAGAKEITVFDRTCHYWRDCYKLSGIEDAAKKLGAKVVSGDDEKYFREYHFPNAKSLKTAKIHQAILDCDAWINCPVMKNHSGAKMTLCMKNHMGIIWDRRFMHTHDLDQCIADLCTIKPAPVLNIIDAYRAMLHHGPQGQSLDDVVTPKALFMGTDIVAVDTLATKFFAQFTPMPLENVKYLPHGEELGLGTMNPPRESLKRINLKKQMN